MSFVSKRRHWVTYLKPQHILLGFAHKGGTLSADTVAIGIKQLLVKWGDYATPRAEFDSALQLLSNKSRDGALSHSSARLLFDTASLSIAPKEVKVSVFNTLQKMDKAPITVTRADMETEAVLIERESEIKRMSLGKKVDLRRKIAWKVSTREKESLHYALPGVLRPLSMRGVDPEGVRELNVILSKTSPRHCFQLLLFAQKAAKTHPSVHSNRFLLASLVCHRLEAATLEGLVCRAPAGIDFHTMVLHAPEEHYALIEECTVDGRGELVLQFARAFPGHAGVAERVLKWLEGAMERGVGVKENQQHQQNALKSLHLSLQDGVLLVALLWHCIDDIAVSLLNGAGEGAECFPAELRVVEICRSALTTATEWAITALPELAKESPRLKEIVSRLSAMTTLFNAFSVPSVEGYHRNGMLLRLTRSVFGAVQYDAVAMLALCRSADEASVTLMEQMMAVRGEGEVNRGEEWVLLTLVLNLMPNTTRFARLRGEVEGVLNATPPFDLNAPLNCPLSRALLDHLHIESRDEMDYILAGVVEEHNTLCRNGVQYA